MLFANTPEPPYYAVIFTSVLRTTDAAYGEMAKEMELLVKNQPGFLGMESSHSDIGITISYWESLDAIKNWKNNIRHTEAQNKGKSVWYSAYKVRIAKVEKDYKFNFEKL